MSLDIRKKGDVTGARPPLRGTDNGDGTMSLDVAVTQSNASQTAGSTATGIQVQRVGGDDGTNVQSFRQDAQRKLLVGLRHSTGAEVMGVGYNSADGTASAGVAGLQSAAFNLGFNGSTWDRQRNNTEGTLQASAARTATTASANQTNHNGTRCRLILRVSSAGTGSLVLRLQGVTPMGYATNLAESAAITAVGTYSIELGPGSSTAGSTTDGYVARTAGFAPRTWRGMVVHSDASSWTYSLEFQLNV
jgi:hypothetical protein